MSANSRKEPKNVQKKCSDRSLDGSDTTTQKSTDSRVQGKKIAFFQQLLMQAIIEKEIPIDVRDDMCSRNGLKVMDHIQFDEKSDYSCSEENGQIREAQNVEEIVAELKLPMKRNFGKFELMQPEVPSEDSTYESNKKRIKDHKIAPLKIFTITKVMLGAGAEEKNRSVAASNLADRKRRQQKQIEEENLPMEDRAVVINKLFEYIKEYDYRTAQVGTRSQSAKLHRLDNVKTIPVLNDVLVETAGIKPAHIEILIEGALERQRDRPISEVIKKLTAWAQLYNGVLMNETQSAGGKAEMFKFTLEQAAKLVNVCRRSLDNYLLQLNEGRKYGFDFNANYAQGISVLTRYNQMMRSQERKNTGSTKDVTLSEIYEK